MKILVNNKPYLDRRTAFKTLGIDRKYIGSVKKALAETGNAEIPGFIFALMAKGTKAKEVKIAQRLDQPALGVILDTFCVICGRIGFGSMVGLGHTKWRHSACAPGSTEWCAYFESLPKAQRTPEGQLLYNNAKRKELL